MKSLREVILSLAAQAHDKFKAILSIIEANLNSEKYPEGLLTKGKEAYLDCVRLDLTKLKSVLDSDMAYWKESKITPSQQVTRNFEKFLAR